MFPRPSEESLSTLISRDADDVASVFSYASEETLSAGSLAVFGNRLLSYIRIRELPIVAGHLKSELVLYASAVALKEGGPLLSLQLSKLHFLKKNAPLHHIYIHGDGDKEEYCKVYFRILSNNLTCYVLMFSHGENVVLFNNALTPCCDAIYKNTKIRIFGATGGASAFGNGIIKTFVLEDKAPILADGVPSAEDAKSMKDVKINFPNSSLFYDAIVKQDKVALQQLVAKGKPLVNVPFATYVDHGKEKMAGVKVDGSIRLFESAEEDIQPVPREESLVNACILLVLSEQEMRKMRGNNKPTYVRSSE